MASAREITEQYFAHVDAGRLDLAAKLMTDDVKFTFANAPTVTGRHAAAAAIQMVLDLCTDIKHSIVHWMELPASRNCVDVMCEIRIRYHLKSGAVIDIPGSVYAAVTTAGQYSEQRLYGDLCQVFAA